MTTTAIVEYETTHGKITLSPDIIRKYLVSGQGNVTDQEIIMFLSLCKYQKLNPFLREAYLIKYGSEPATMIVGKDVFTKRASANPSCTGWEAGIAVERNGQLEYRAGSLYIASAEKLVGGWAKVYRKDWKNPFEVTVSLQEYMQRKKDGTPFPTWAKMPATMIRKVALVQALREAFPEDFQGMYAPEEMPVEPSALNESIVTVDAEPVAVDQRQKMAAEADEALKRSEAEFDAMAEQGDEAVDPIDEELHRAWDILGTPPAKRQAILNKPGLDKHGLLVQLQDEIAKRGARTAEKPKPEAQKKQSAPAQVPPPASPPVQQQQSFF